jgi:hypothetical protein
MFEQTVKRLTHFPMISGVLHCPFGFWHHIPVSQFKLKIPPQAWPTPAAVAPLDPAMPSMMMSTAMAR